MKSGCEDQRTITKRSVELPVLASAGGEVPAMRASHTSKWRAAVLTTLTLLMAIHVIQWWLTGSTVSPIEPSETMYTFQNGAINAGLIFFSLAILATLVFGRFVCGWGCHIVALQDFCAWLLNKIGLKPRPFRSRLLVWVPLIVALYMFVWPTVGRWIFKSADEPLFPQFSNHLVTTEFWATFPPVAVAIPFLFICGFMTVYFLGSKGFCTYACPYGGFFGIADKLAPGKIRVTDACNACGHCTATCTSNVIVHAEVAKYGMVVDPGCMKCMDCISVCPNEALYFGFGRPAVGISTKAVNKNYSLTWTEELLAAVIFFGSFMAVWDVYQLVPMLMALGIACVTTFIALRLLRLFEFTDVSFYKYALRSQGKLKPAGWIFIAFTVVWLALNVHSGWIRYHEARGAAAFNNLQVPDDLALARANPSQWLSPSDQTNVAEGRRHFATALTRGLFANVEALPKAAWLDYLSGDTDRALDTLGRAASLQSGQAKGLSLYYRGAILNRLGRSEEALTSLEGALTAAPDLILAREERGEALWQLGHHEQAVAAWQDAIEQNPQLVLANYQLAGASAAMGDTQAAQDYESQADEATPDDAYFRWVLAARLDHIGMKELARKQYDQAVSLDPKFRMRPIGR